LRNDYVAKVGRDLSIANGLPRERRLGEAWDVNDSQPPAAAINEPTDGGRDALPVNLRAPVL
jgi:hypothetical protein